MSDVQDCEDLLHEIADARARRVEPEVRLLVRGTAGRVQAFELFAVRGERPPPVGGKPGDEIVERDVEPHRQAVALDRRALTYGPEIAEQSPLAVERP